ncbi:exonuclease SbcCD subunit D C-terminal domain-containing protein [Moraxella oblonga]|uniref:exonuclease SbcCD subunit D C-terminal domain-containing protein n=1 Tax=Moraxella oblonga TaxID=200413 RepID=UPI00082E25F4|nr:exonuclease SbcCD subunit D C-terminal domain-containing protein [Moraxella oblonga]
MTTKSALRVLHTSDWHIGKRLYHQNRYEEFSAFLTWLHAMICQYKVDILIVAGDVFDTMTPSNKAQSLYYDFLAKVADSPCQHIIITAGNHDSPTLLDTSKHILKNLNIHIIGVISPNTKDDCLTLCDKTGNPQAIIMGVPYLRDKDIKASTHASNHESTTLSAITHHYHTLACYAKEAQNTIFTQTGKKIPIIATGHLFCAGANISAKDDGMRELYVGTLGQIPTSIFDECIDYVALGHIHAPQKVGGLDHIRYCGSPLALGFGEIGKTKQVLLIDFVDTLHIQPIPVPTFQPLHHIQGDLDHIYTTLDRLISQNISIWVQIIYTGNSLEPQLANDIQAYLTNSQVIALNIQNKTLYQNSLHTPQHKHLDSLDPVDVFTYRLDKEQLDDDDEKQSLLNAYQYVLQTLHESDVRAD